MRDPSWTVVHLEFLMQLDFASVVFEEKLNSHCSRVSCLDYLRHRPSPVEGMSALRLLCIPYPTRAFTCPLD